MIFLSNFFNSFKEGMNEFGHTIAIIINSILLSVVYFIGVGLTTIFVELRGKKIMEDKLDPSKETYWEEGISKEINLEDSYRQF